VDPTRQSVPEAGAYRILRVVLSDLHKAERALAIIQEAAPDLERALHLGAIRSAIAELRTVVPSAADS
jgi:hypothetical protein